MKQLTENETIKYSDMCRTSYGWYHVLESMVGFNINFYGDEFTFYRSV